MPRPSVLQLSGNGVFFLRYSTGEAVTIALPLPVLNAEILINRDNTAGFDAFVSPIDGWNYAVRIEDLFLRTGRAWFGIP